MFDPLLQSYPTASSRSFIMAQTHIRAQNYDIDHTPLQVQTFDDYEN